MNKLANLTLIAGDYNSKISNSPFETKRGIENGFKDSKFTLNKFMANCDKWGEEELKDRNKELTEQALKIWPSITSEFIPEVKPQGTLIPLDENTDFTGVSIESFRFDGVDYPAKSWKEFIVNMLKLLHYKDKTILSELVNAEPNSALTSAFESDPKDFIAGEKIDAGIYFCTKNPTSTKVKILCHIMSKLDIPSTDVLIRLQNKESSDTDVKLEDSNL